MHKATIISKNRQGTMAEAVVRVGKNSYTRHLRLLDNGSKGAGHEISCGGSSKPRVNDCNCKGYVFSIRQDGE